MYANSLTVSTQTYDLISSFPTNSVRRDATYSITNPHEVLISQETFKDGRKSAGVVFKDTTITDSISCPDTKIRDAVSAMVKVQFNPLSSRADIEADLNAQLDLLVAFLGVADNRTKLINGEV
jgi:hypothetical protein